MSVFWVLVLIWVALIFVVGIKLAINDGKRKAEIKAYVAANYKLDEVYFPSRGVIGFNFAEQTILLGSGLDLTKYDFSRIITVEVVQDGVTLVTVNRGSQLMGAVTGGLLFGGTGALIGGLSGSSVAKARVKSIALKIVVENPAKPLYTFSFFYDGSKTGGASSGILIQAARQSVQRVHAQILVAMRQAQTAQIKPTVEAPISNLVTLKTLWEMKQGGILSEEEFNVQKARLLGSG